MKFKVNDKVLVSCDDDLFYGSEGIVVGMEEYEGVVTYFVDLYKTNDRIPLSEVEDLYVHFRSNELKLIKRG